MICFVLIFCLVMILACIEAHRLAGREESRQRLGYEVGTPQMVKDKDRSLELPEFCPLCSRPMSLPAGRATITTLTGTEHIYCCSYCLALPGLDSMVTAAAVSAASPNRTEPAQPCGDLSDAMGHSATLPGGSPAAGTF